MADDGSFKLRGLTKNLPIFSISILKNLSLFSDGIVITDHFLEFSSRTNFYSQILFEKPSNV